MHNLLERQLRKAGRTDSDDGGDIDLDTLLAAVSATYEQADRARRRTDRSMKMMIDELDQLNHHLEALVESRTAALTEREAELERQNLRFNAAIEGMPLALTMYDAEQKLVVHNRQAEDMFDLARGELQPGMDIQDVLAARTKRGVVYEDPAEHVSDTLRSIRRGETLNRIVEQPDGRAFSMLVSPTAEGGWVSVHQDITERRRAERQIEHMARHDALTGLPNRMLFLDRLDQALREVGDGCMIAIHYVDVDNFKAVNDTLGHQAGDEMLVTISERLQRGIKGANTVARLGGDEFVIIQRSASQAETERLALRIGDMVRRPLRIQGHAILSDVSIGVAMAPDHGVDATRLLKNADIALYRAKAEGRGRHRFFEPGMDAHIKTRRDLEIALRTALAKNEMYLVYQPIVSAQTGRITCCEALIRWENDTRGLVEPCDFIPLAEEIGLIVPIGEWVLETACHEATSWPEETDVAVNLSPIQVRQEGFVEAVVRALESSGLPARRLHLEITESVLLNDAEQTLAALHQLRALGVKISMDDFGTGYSSLSYLRSFPFDKIKIDRSFVHSTNHGGDSVAIVAAIAGLAKDLSIATTAEGVETEAQMALVRDLGCSELQGYFLSRPLPTEAVRDLLASKKGMGLPTDEADGDLKRTAQAIAS